MRILANTLFSLAVGGAFLMNAFRVPQQLILLALVSVALSAIVTHLMRIRSMGVVGVGGLSLVYSELAGINPAGMVMTAIIAVLITAAVILMIFADLSCASKRKRPNEVSTS